MTKVKFEEITINISRKGVVEQKSCYADMVVNNNRIHVQLQKLNTREWVAIGLKSKTIYPLSTNNKESFEDWLNDPEAYVCGVVPQQN